METEMRKKKNYHWLRHMRHAGEKRANGSRKDRELYKWTRAKRAGRNLPDPWDDCKTTTQKTWKVKRPTQYYPNGRGKRNTIIVDGRVYEWRLIDYFEEHNIPYHIDEVRESYQWYSIYHIPNRWIHCTRIIGYEITWWSDKDIGIEYIIGSNLLPE